MLTKHERFRIRRANDAQTMIITSRRSLFVRAALANLHGMRECGHDQETTAYFKREYARNMAFAKEQCE